MVSFRDIHRVVLRFIQGQVLIAIIISIIETLGLYLIGMPYATLLGFIGGCPYYSLLRALYRRDSSPRCCPDDIAMESLMDRGCFLLFNSWIIFTSPRIMEGKLRLHPVVTMLAVIVGGKMFSVWGLLFGVPLVAMLKVLLKRVHRIVAG